MGVGRGLAPRGDSLGRNTPILQQLRNLKIETVSRRLGGGMVGLQYPGPRVTGHDVTSTKWGFMAPDSATHVAWKLTSGRIFDTPGRRDELISK